MSIELLRSIWVRFAKSKLDRECVFQADGLKDGTKLVIPVRPFMKNAEIEVELCERRNGNAHSLVLQQGENVVAVQLLATVEEGKFNYEAKPRDFAFELLH